MIGSGTPHSYSLKEALPPSKYIALQYADVLYICCFPLESRWNIIDIYASKTYNFFLYLIFIIATVHRKMIDSYHGNE